MLLLKRIALASMIVTFVVNNAQAVEPSLAIRIITIKLEGPARQKYNNFERRYEPVERYLKTIGKTGLVFFLAGGVAAAASGIAHNKAFLQLSALVSGAGLATAFVTASTGIYLDDYAEQLHEKAIAEDKKALESLLL